MPSLNQKTVLISGASIAGLATAFWLNKIGYKVTVVERAKEPRTAGAAFDIKGSTVDVVKRMGIFDELVSNRLTVDLVEFVNAENKPEGSMSLRDPGEEPATDEIEIERDKFVKIMLGILQQEVEFIFDDRITGLSESEKEITALFHRGAKRSFDLVVGGDGMHSGVRNIWFGEESGFVRFLGAYFAIGITNKLLIRPKTMQMYNVPGKVIMLNAYNNKTDIIFCFTSEKEISYDYRQTGQLKELIAEHFSGQRWRTAELLDELHSTDNFYFDKFCQIKMPSWSKGRVVLVGDAGYCASPAAGMGGSLSVSGAAALADALQKFGGDFGAAFAAYESGFRPFVEEVQATAEFNLWENFIPGTHEAIARRNSQSLTF